MLKKLDKYMLKGFIAPLIVTFFIALFVLIMQFLWTYIDDIVGKGVGMILLMELISYLSVSLFPMALPIAVLISSVMIMGNMSERYELASFKSAGVPLLRVMLPLIFFATGIAFFSFLCSNYFIPVANLQFKSRLYDIRKQKPTLNLEQGVFNEDFQNFVIHIGKKEADNKTIHDVIIYDHVSNQSRFNMITARRGEMFNTEDRKYFVMNLFDGHQYQETKSNTTKKGKTYPFVRTNFKEWTKIFDLSEFDLKETDTRLFKSHESMLSSMQLMAAIDSLDVKSEKQKDGMLKLMNQTVHARRPPVKVKTTIDHKLNSKYKNKKPSKRPSFTSSKYNKGRIYEQKIDQPIEEYDSFLALFSKTDQNKLLSKVQTNIRSLQGKAKSTNRSLERNALKRAKYVFELHSKLGMSVVCIIFLFIGAPMGAIVRKGGFGYPILIAIIFFMVFMVLTIFSEKMSEGFFIHPILAAWLPCLVLIPIGAILTYRAMNDKVVLNTNGLSNFAKKIGSIFTRNKKSPLAES